jgi:tight adherence protein B
MMGLILLGTLVATFAVLLGVRDLIGVAGDRRQIVQAVVGDDVYGGLKPVDRWDRMFRGTSLGRRLERELVLAGVDRRPIVVAGAGLLVALGVALILWTLLAPVIGVLGSTAGFIAVRAYLARERSRRLEAFVVQMPELARVLANASNAGLSIHTAVGVAAEELEEPARTEMKRVDNRLRFGVSLDRALAELSERLPSREVAVLVSTLVVSSRSGGSMVTALRDIAETLEQRKETRREIRTTLAQSLATGYLVIALGFAILLMLNLIYPGTVELMTNQLIGQVALVVAALLFGGGFAVIRRMTRIEP